jgi:hypothetical protein
MSTPSQIGFPWKIVIYDKTYASSVKIKALIENMNSRKRQLFSQYDNENIQFDSHFLQLPTEVNAIENQQPLITKLQKPPKNPILEPSIVRLEIRRGATHRGFESLTLRQIPQKSPPSAGFFVEFRLVRELFTCPKKVRPVRAATKGSASLTRFRECPPSAGFFVEFRLVRESFANFTFFNA